MAHRVYEKEAKAKCPRCECKDATLAVYHFGNTVTAECKNCGFGKVHADNEGMALSRLYGKYLEYDKYLER